MSLGVNLEPKFNQSVNQSISQSKERKKLEASELALALDLNDIRTCVRILTLNF